MSKVQNLSLGWKVLEVWKVWIHEKHDDITPMETSACHRKTFWSKKDKTTFTFAFFASFAVFFEMYTVQCTFYIIRSIKFFDNIFNEFYEYVSFYEFYEYVSFFWKYVYPYEYVWQVLKNFAATARQFPNFQARKKTQKQKIQEKI